jgi:Icc protein
MKQQAIFSVPQDISSDIVSWVHFGDLHMVTRDEQNYRDFLSLVDEVNNGTRHSVHFAYFPGDNADHGKTEEYEAVRDGLDRLAIPYFSIVGDHDVHFRSFDNYLRFMSPRTHYDFRIGPYRFFALNAHDSANPKHRDLLPPQLSWLSQGLVHASSNGEFCVFFLHCYPGELGLAAEPTAELIAKHRVLLVDMGHTHYNEIANDGTTLYTATRSTGQVEEGPVGFSVTNLDKDVVSWRFKELGAWPLVMITAPADERLITNPQSPHQIARGQTQVRLKAWSDAPIEAVSLSVNGEPLALRRTADDAVWEATWNCAALPDGRYMLQASARDTQGRTSTDEIRAVVARTAQWEPPKRAARDQDNIIGAWIEHGILGTQLGPNKNGRKW